MTYGRWRTAFASVIGTSHSRAGTSCQDASACVVVKAEDGTEILLAVVADGAGTADRSEVGAALAVDLFTRDFREAALLDPSLASIDKTFVTDWIRTVQDAIQEIASREGNGLADYACTLVGAIVGISRAAYLQIGDGAIVVAGGEFDDYGWISWPQHGEYANTTNFLTQDDANRLMFFETGPSVRQIALFTDGIERLVLDFSSRTVHSPAFKPIFEWLTASAADASHGPSAELSAYLRSEHVNRRTDDDKSLVMAIRDGSSTGS